jgi:hypothetical protein
MSFFQILHWVLFNLFILWTDFPHMCFCTHFIDLNVKCNDFVDILTIWAGRRRWHHFLAALHPNLLSLCKCSPNLGTQVFIEIPMSISPFFSPHVIWRDRSYSSLEGPWWLPTAFWIKPKFLSTYGAWSPHTPCHSPSPVLGFSLNSLSSDTRPSIPFIALKCIL